jgi:hypothetical protein
MVRQSSGWIAVPRQGDLSTPWVESIIPPPIAADACRLHKAKYPGAYRPASAFRGGPVQGDASAGMRREAAKGKGKR